MDNFKTSEARRKLANKNRRKRDKLNQAWEEGFPLTKKQKDFRNKTKLESKLNQKLTKYEVNKMEITISDIKRVEEGKHYGKIVDIIYRTEPYEYTDLVIELSNKMKLKAGYPTMVSPESKLGRLLTLFGGKLEVGKSIDPDKVFIGQGCSFLVKQETTKRGSFAVIVPDSIKPVDPKDEVKQ